MRVEIACDLLRLVQMVFVLLRAYDVDVGCCMQSRSSGGFRVVLHPRVHLVRHEIANLTWFVPSVLVNSLIQLGVLNIKESPVLNQSFASNFTDPSSRYMSLNLLASPGP